jgi:hypothetical protein
MREQMRMCLSCVQLGGMPDMKTWLRIAMIFILCLAPFAEHLHAQGPQCFLWTDTEWYGYPAGWIPINPVNNHYCIALAAMRASGRRDAAPLPQLH